MKQRWFTILCACLLVLALSVCVSAQTPSVTDGADLLTDEQEATLAAQLDAVADTYQMEVLVVTTESIDIQSPAEYAAAFYYENVGASQDGVMLLISMEERDWYIWPNGACIDMFDASTAGIIGDAMLDDLSAGEYAAAFATFADWCDYTINGELNGYPFPFGMALLISFGIAFVVALITVSIMKAKLKSVRAQTAANQYVKDGSMQLTQSNDFFLYRTVHRVKKQTESNSSSSSSGSRGGGGKF